jgi:hypothetical protein
MRLALNEEAIFGIADCFSGFDPATAAQKAAQRQVFSSFEVVSPW